MLNALRVINDLRLLRASVSLAAAIIRFIVVGTYPKSARYALVEGIR